MTPVVSVVIVNWNGRDVLRECLRSLDRVKHETSLEVIVVDNGSTDGSQALVLDDFPSVSLIQNAENLGFSSANNIGIRHARGEYVALVNSDVVVLPGCMSSLLAYVDEHSDVGIAGPTMLSEAGLRQRSTMSFPSLTNNLWRALALDTLFPKILLFDAYLNRHVTWSQPRQVDVLSGFFWLVNRKALDEVGLLDEGFFFYGEDIDYCRRMKEKRWRCVFVPQASAIHFGAASSRRHPIRFYLEMHKANLRYWRKHHGRMVSRLYLAEIFLQQALRAVGHGVRLSLQSRPASTTRYEFRRSIACLRWIIGGPRST